MSKLYIDTPHLLFDSHETQKDIPIKISEGDRAILRELGRRYAGIVSDPVNNQKKSMWKNINDLNSGKPMVWINEVCWNEMDVNDELRLQTGSKFCQKIETEIRRVIYQWEHMQGDMVVEPVIYSPLIIENTGIGVTPEADEIKETEEGREIASRRFKIQISNEEDIEKIKVPQINHRHKRTEDFFQAYSSLFDGIIRVEKRGSPGFWFAPWDDIISWTGVQQGLTDLALRPEYMQKIIERLITVYLQILDQFEQKNLLASNNTNVRVGSGAYGYTDQLPESGGTGYRTQDIWGACAAQIFGEVSPAMHELFGINFEIRWLERFGLSYYGCCEPLHNKIDILKKIPNLRKISFSPWAKIDDTVADISDKYVISLKPNPSVLAAPRWKPELAREELKTKLDIAHKYDCKVEIIMKDISTVQHEPQRLWQWVDMASRLTEQYTLE